VGLENIWRGLMAVKKSNTRIAHGGACPPGKIYDHNKNSPTYGRCISVLASKKRKPQKSGMGKGGFRYG
jgi:hypothetical protein